MSVQKLVPGVSSAIRSGHSIDCVTRCVLELVQNSVDASASSVVVKVDTSSWRLQVVDDGEGIPRDDLSLIGERYATSKCQDSQRFGFRGEALASIVQVAQTVELCSRHHFSQMTYCKLFQNGGSVISSANSGLSHAGTTVTVNKLFSNLPVRRRHMSPSLEMERVRNSLTTSLLTLPHLSLSLHDNQTGHRLLQVPKATSLLSRFHQLFGASAKSSDVQHKYIEYNGVKISALLSARAVNGLQLIFHNRRCMECEALHLLVSGLLQPALTQLKTDDNHHMKTARRPFYIIATEGDMELDTHLNSAKTQIFLQQEQRVAAALTFLIQSFLHDNHISVGHCHEPSLTIPPPSSPDPALSTTLCAVPSVTCQSHDPHHWRAAVDPISSQCMYVHPVSGCTRMANPTGGNVSFSCKLTSSKTQDIPSIRVQSTASLRSIPVDWKNPIFSAGDCAVLTVNSGVRGQNKSLISYKFSKCSLQHVRVLGQVDNKFIACLFHNKSFNLLVAIDQHAAHERVRLEALLRGLYDDQQQVKSAALDPPLALTLTATQQRIARSFSGQLTAIGVELQWRSGEVFAGSVPAVLMDREGAMDITHIQDVVQSHLQMLESTSGGGAGLPSCLAAVLQSQACHGAIRFGDYLSHNECEQLVQSLASCSLPFQCAHGRPSLAPLLDLTLLAQRSPDVTTPFPTLRGLADII